MSERVEFGSKAAADQAREQWADQLCSDDDRRLKAVTFAGSAPEAARLDAADSRGEQEAGAGQVGLTDHERAEIAFEKGRAGVPHARSVKGIAAAEGVSDWLAYYDPTLTVDEHREVMERAAKEGGGRRREAGDSAAARAGRAARAAKDQQCDHARGHCKHGDPDACEYLQTTCGLDESEVQSMLSEFEGDDQAIEGAAAGALRRSWSGYQGATSRFEQAIAAAEQAWTNAQQAAKAINGIREGHGQDPIHFERLEEEQASLLDLTRRAAADCHECHADHSGHSHDVTSGEREHVGEAVIEGAAETPVGTSEDTDEAVLEMDDQRDLSGERVDDQAHLAGGEQGEAAQGEVEQPVERNEGGLAADERENTGETSTEQDVPEEFAVAEGGQENL